jgi:hypothetical protein
MELVTTGLVVGLILPVAPPGVETPGTPEITFDRLSHIFGEIASSYGYRNLQSHPSGMGGRISKIDIRNGVQIEPGLVQFVDMAEFGPERSIDEAVGVIRVVTKHLGISQVMQLGVKWVCTTDSPGNDGRAFVLNRLLARADEDIAELSLGGSIYAGARFVTRPVDQHCQYVIRIEPLESDPRRLYLDVDAAVPGTPDLLAQNAAAVGEAIRGALTYMQVPLKNYLEKLA